ncbi:rod-binding protein [Ferrimonas balearica]|uniref:rod-binding protein n=1 Tax=Ferrimonas balearica TaxID=44012 RepID=UPI001C991D94|nr:rod-binding protein [Ferrimonas balearica]MBY5920024.1 rod-binding protein [Ferrimonas balearica]MBY5997291.1 rod-binding protein [Ferrimonas balearica]
MTRIEHPQSALAGMSAHQLKQQHGESGAVREVARQFETQFLQTVLKQMRSATDALKDDEGPLSEKRGVFHDFYDAELAQNMSRHQGIGLAEVMVRQLSPREESTLKPQAEAVAHNGQETQPQVVPIRAMQPALVIPRADKES